jgi:hypothetical protein
VKADLISFLSLFKSTAREFYQEDALQVAQALKNDNKSWRRYD